MGALNIDFFSFEFPMIFVLILDSFLKNVVSISFGIKFTSLDIRSLIYGVSISLILF